MVQAVLSLGSNIDAQANLAMAVKAIRGDLAQALFSKIYRSQAVGFAGDDFLNMVVSLQTDCSVAQLLQWTDSLEQLAGRIRQQRGRFDSRTLDVDILIYGDLVGSHFGTTWPDDDIIRYAHVLLPLAELHPEQRHPVLKKTYAQLWKEFDSRGVQIQVTKLVV